MTDLPIVSVVIPTYNSPALLLETLATVFQQTFKDYEVLVINDGSTDDTLEQLTPLQRQYGSQLRIVTQPNAGIGAARNRGIEQARGKYVAFLDHDDLWLPEKLAIQVQYMQARPECAACGTLFVFSNEPGKLHFRLDQVANARGIVERPFLRATQGISVFQSCTLMIDREKCSGLGYATQRGAIEDVSFHCMLMTRGMYGIAGDHTLAIYRQHDENFSKKPDYYYSGIKLLRRLQHQGQFLSLPAEQQRDIDMFLTHLGRIGTIMQIRFGSRIRGAGMLLTESLNQLRYGRFRFLLIAPVMLCMPRKLIEMLYSNRSGVA